MRFHRGERRIQSLTGRRETVKIFSERAIRPYMPEQHRQMFHTLPFLVAASRDPAGRIWATLLTGQPGFVATPSSTRLKIISQPLPGDALSGGFVPGSSVGLLGIELASRRRNRVNGRIIDNADGELEVFVQQSYGNCAKYITPRQWQMNIPARSGKKVLKNRYLTTLTRSWIRSADTFFIASGFEELGHPASGLDVSHRGGAAGFVEVESASRLLFPDYAGNNFFNTLGNITVNPQVALLFIDFSAGSLLQLSGSASIHWDKTPVSKRAGAQRLVSVDIERIVVSLSCLPLIWQE